MLVKHLNDCAEIIANDGCVLRELIHPKNDPVELPYSLAIARVMPRGRTYAHFLRQTEVYYIMSGTGRMHIGDEERDLREGDAVVIPAEYVQWIENTGNTWLLFATIVSPPWRDEDDIRLTDPSPGNLK